MKELLYKDTRVKWAVTIGVAVLVTAVVTVAGAFAMKKGDGGSFLGSFFGIGPDEEQKEEALVPQVAEGVAPFSSEEDFLEYLQRSIDLGSSSAGGFAGMGAGGTRNAAVDMAMPEAATGMGSAEKSVAAPTTSSPDRFSGTTVQVLGIDEPDVVKTNGKEIYVSERASFYYPYYRGGGPEIMVDGGMTKEMIAPYPYPDPKGKTTAVSAFPLDALKVAGTIEDGGELLLSGTNLLVFGNQKLTGYDVTDPAKPAKKWDMTYEKSELVASRLYGDTVYLVMRNTINMTDPCPVRPLVAGGTTIEIACSSIYHPVDPVPVDVTFSVLAVDPVSGSVKNKTAFIGSASQSVVYMSPTGIYVTYYYQTGIYAFFADFFATTFRTNVPASFIERLEKIKGYDLAEETKLMEFDTQWNKYLSSLDNDERLRIENEFANKMGDYYETRKRDVEKTGIVRIDVPSLVASANGAVPGYPLNQFALDEHNGVLRIATTIGEQGWFGSWRLASIQRGATVNDVYTLDGALDILGSVKDLGEKERIYAVRFLGDKGYVVTFRQTDPLYVIDLANASAPKVTGELKIPGYSSFLHPIDDDHLIGVGQEDWRVKLSLFDVSDPAAPKETAKYILDESWSDAVNTHHAFLLDTKHKVFFVPGGRGGYVFSYDGNALGLKKAVSDINALRAVYINDSLYVVGTDKIVVLNEKTWEREAALELK